MGEVAVKEGTVPLARIDILEGRPPEVIEELHSRVASVVAEIAGTPLDRVRTIITEIPAANLGNRRRTGRAGAGSGNREEESRGRV